MITMITGAGRGIGKEIAEKFAKEGHDLYLLIHKKKDADQISKIFRKKYDIKLKCYVGDLRDKSFITKINKVIPKVDNLINNAAIACTKYFLQISEKNFNDLTAVNLKAIFELSQIISKKMIQNEIKGSIINISSQLGHIGAYNRTLFCMTKFGLEGLTKAMAMDLGKHGIRVNTVCPTKTIVNQQERHKTKKRLNIIRNKIPLRKFSTTKQIASIVFFLTSKDALSITGTSILSDGGWTAGK